MVFSHIVGIAFLPVSIILYLHEFGIINMDSIFGIKLMLLGAIGIIAVQVTDIVSSHVEGDYVILTYIVGIILCFPAFLYFISLVATLPDPISKALPLITASFLFVEGLSSFYIGG